MVTLVKIGVRSIFCCVLCTKNNMVLCIVIRCKKGGAGCNRDCIPVGSVSTRDFHQQVATILYSNLSPATIKLVAVGSQVYETSKYCIFYSE